jgi:hypothetical protein
MPVDQPPFGRAIHEGSGGSVVPPPLIFLGRLIPLIFSVVSSRSSSEIRSLSFAARFAQAPDSGSGNRWFESTLPSSQQIRESLGTFLVRAAHGHLTKGTLVVGACGFQRHHTRWLQPRAPLEWVGQQSAICHTNRVAVPLDLFQGGPAPLALEFEKIRSWLPHVVRGPGVTEDMCAESADATTGADALEDLREAVP